MLINLALSLPLVAGAAAFVGVTPRAPGGLVGARRAGSPARCNDGIEREVQATEAWLDEFVIRLGLCPWAKLTRGLAPSGTPRTRIVTLPGGVDCIDRHVSAVMREAKDLRYSPGDGSSSFFTTLLVFPDGAFRGSPPADCGEFPRLVRRVQDGLNSEPVPDRVDLLAFHRYRNDEGPGTREDVDDAAHFSVRSPYRPSYVKLPA
jgi:hypothetical protein